MILRLSTLHTCSVRLKSTLPLLDGMGRHVIIKSSSVCIYENLALEDWIHDHVDLQNRSMLLLWRSSPAVVIGRHQNPWQECNLPLMRRLGIPVARRRSGGGTVFHDLGNLNMTFFTSKKNHDRQRNLRVITRALKDLSPDLDVNATERFDITLNGRFKISGSASKLGRTCAYHHCTLLCSVDRAALSAVLRSDVSRDIRSNATPSVPSPVRNLCDVDPRLDTGTVTDAVAARYREEFGTCGPIVTLDPTRGAAMPGIFEMTRDVRAWEWVYGRTPKFNVRARLRVDDVIAHLDLDVRGGAVDGCRVSVPDCWLPAEDVNEMTSSLRGCRCCPRDTAAALAAFLRTRATSEDVAGKIRRLCDAVISVM